MIKVHYVIWILYSAIHTFMGFCFLNKYSRSLLSFNSRLINTYWIPFIITLLIYIMTLFTVRRTFISRCSCLANSTYSFSHVISCRGGSRTHLKMFMRHFSVPIEFPTRYYITRVPVTGIGPVSHRLQRGATTTLATLAFCGPQRYCPDF